MPEKQKTQTVEVCRDTARALGCVASRMGMAQKKLASRVLKWYVSQPPELQSVIGWPLPESIRAGVIAEVLRVLQLPGTAAEASLSLGEQVQTAGTGETEAPVSPPADAPKEVKSTPQSDAGRDVKRRQRPRR